MEELGSTVGARDGKVGETVKGSLLGVIDGEAEFWSVGCSVLGDCDTGATTKGVSVVGENEARIAGVCVRVGAIELGVLEGVVVRVGAIELGVLEGVLVVVAALLGAAVGALVGLKVVGTLETNWDGMLVTEVREVGSTEGPYVEARGVKVDGVSIILEADVGAFVTIEGA